MKKAYSFIRNASWLTMIGAVVAGVLLVTVAANAATTISTSITTDGNLSVSGTAAVTGATTLSSTLNVTGLSTFVYASSTSQSLTGNLMVNGMATTTGSSGDIATRGTLAVGQTANAIADMSVGYCTFPTKTIAASSTAYVDCTTNVTISTSDRVMVQATSSLAGNFIIQAASTTGATTINIRILNVGLTDGVSNASAATGVNSVNFWAAR